jgi:hypothetical protein
LRLASTALASLVILAVVGAVETPARADSFVGLRGRIDTINTNVLLHREGSLETMIDEEEVMSTSPASIWVRAFPSQPKMTELSDDVLFQNLEALTKIEEPYNEVLRPRLFGPSVVTLLTRKLADASERPIAPERTTPESNRRLELERILFVNGKVETSTITHHVIFPPELRSLFASEGITPNGIMESQIASQLNRGWTIMAAAIRDKSPSDQVPAKIGPIAFEFNASSLVYPLDVEQTSIQTAAHIRFFIADAEALAPKGYETVWDDRPWEHPREPSGKFVATYNRDIGNGPIEFELNERAGLQVEPDWRLVRTELSTLLTDRRDLEFTPPKRAIVLPPASKKGSGLDLFLCILLGLTPLLYTPESWFLLWLGARARARARASRQDTPVFGVKLWSVYAIVVAAFWFLALDGGARAAAIIPALIGIVQLAVPYVDRDPHPFRAQIRKKKK